MNWPDIIGRLAITLLGIVFLILFVLFLVTPGLGRASTGVGLGLGAVFLLSAAQWAKP